MAKKSLAGLLGSLEGSQADSQPEEVAQPRGRAVAASSKKPVQDAEPRYLQLQRKEARLTAEQLDDLTLLTRRINQARPRGGERVTDNTLIRIAVDLLLLRGEELVGHNESELRKSVGL